MNRDRKEEGHYGNKKKNIFEEKQHEIIPFISGTSVKTKTFEAKKIPLTRTSFIAICDTGYLLLRRYLGNGTKNSQN
ncbi:hypothetical protein L4F92_02575 [Avibacterium sp. 21-595]|uniref:hypothetical protein n=1 Tax=Avibacterium sp. 21-595 TaxID=2911527 RepID=UPI002026A2ED|nr:hypothetical protein [Avibacterium sp. 21-595]URL07677.1 hypothetical protein L4F92_02575 [Avibacterium sp. 21-595]